MSSEINLRTKIITDYIAPVLEGDKLRAKAKELFKYEEPKSQEEVNKLIDSLFQDIVNRINEYLKSPKASALYKGASLMEARSSYSTIIQENIDAGLEKTYHLSTKDLVSKQSRLLSSVSEFFWKVLGY